jgi:hypothetical protein
MVELPLRERVANERRRLKSVRTALSTALARGSGGDKAYVPFYSAIADYMDAAMHRLHIQDIRMGEMIRDKLGTVGPAEKAALAELAERLTGNQQHLEAFLEAAAKLKSHGTTSLGAFEQVSREYTDFITRNMGHHGATTDLAQKLFSFDDWAYMASINEAEASREQQLYERVFETAPAGLEIARAN